MLLDRREAQLFTQTKMLLEMEANKRLKILPYSLRYQDPTVEDEGDLLDAIWSDPSVVDEIADDLPSSVPARVRDLLASWSHPLYGEFAVTKLGAEVLFLGFGHAFAVSGITRSIPSIVGTFPCFVRTALLPLRNLIVYDGSMSVYDVTASERMAKAIEDEARECKEEGRIVRSGKQLFEMAPSLIEEEKKHLGEEAFPADESDTEGFHRGVLAGLSGKEREQYIDEHDPLRADSPDLAASLARYDALDIRRESQGRVPDHTVLSELTGYKKYELEEIAKNLGMKGISRLRKKELTEAIAASIGSAPGFLRKQLPTLMPEELERVRELLSEGGEKTFDLTSADEVDAANKLPMILGVGGFFVSGNTATYMLAEPLMEQSASLDWDGIMEDARRNERIFDHVGAAAVIRGVVRMDQAAAEFGEGLSTQELTDMLTTKLDQIDAEFDMVSFEDDPDTLYLVDGVLDVLSREDLGISTDAVVIADMPRDSMIGKILAMQRGKDPYPLPEGVETADDAYDWIYGLDVCENMRRYFDEHVPDGENDFYFADAAIDDLVPLMQMGIQNAQSINAFMGVLEDRGYIPNKGMLQPTLDLLMKMANGVPVWSNNGWPHQELFEKDNADSAGRR